MMRETEYASRRLPRTSPIVKVVQSTYARLVDHRYYHHSKQYPLPHPSTHHQAMRRADLLGS